MSSFEVRRVAAADTFELRRRVLRPHQELAEMALPGDDHPDTAHIGALDSCGTIVGTASVRREAPPWEPAREGSWRLRGIATP